MGNVSVMRIMIVLFIGKVTEEQLDKWCKEIDEEEHRREQETLAHSQWLKEREQRKQVRNNWALVQTHFLVIFAEFYRYSIVGREIFKVLPPKS